VTYTTSTGPDGRILYHPFKYVMIQSLNRPLIIHKLIIFHIHLELRRRGSLIHRRWWIQC
jgi:hypothetical protein